MKHLRTRIVSLVLTATMLLGLVPYSAFAAPGGYVKTFSGNNSSVSITQSGDYKIADGTKFTGTSGSSAMAAMTIGDNLEVTLWFEGDAYFTGANADSLTTVATPGIAVGEGSTLVFQKADTASKKPTIEVVGGNGHHSPAESRIGYIGASGGAAGIGTCGALGGQNYGEKGQDAAPMLAKKIVIQKYELNLYAIGGKGGNPGSAAQGTTGQGKFGMAGFNDAVSGAGGSGAGAGGDDGAAIGTGGGGGGAGGKGGAGVTVSGSGAQQASGGGGGGGGQSSNWVEPKHGLPGNYYLHGGGGGGGGAAYAKVSVADAHWSGGLRGLSGGEKNPFLPEDGQPGDYYRSSDSEIYCGGGQGGAAGGKGGAAGECTYNHGVDYPEGKGFPGGDGGAAGKAAEDFTNLTYIAEVAVEDPGDFVYDGNPIDPTRIKVISSISDSEKTFYFRPNGTEEAYTATPPADPGTYDVRVDIKGQGNYEPAVGYGTITIQNRWLWHKDLTVKLEPNDFLYKAGVEQAPKLVVQDRGVDMNPETDYEVSGTLRATNCGEYEIVVTGKGFYGGKMTLEWKIHEPIMQGVRVYLDGKEYDYRTKYSYVEYDGQPHGIVVTVEDPSDAKILYDTKFTDDYVTAPQTFTEVGVAQTAVKITKEGWNDYRDVPEFKIIPRKVKFAWDTLSFPYDGNPHQPQIYIGNQVEGDKVFLDLDSDFGPQTEVGTYGFRVLQVSGNWPDRERYKLPPWEECRLEFTITPGVPEVTKLPWPNRPTYNTQPQRLIYAGIVKHGTMVYSLNKAGPYSTEIPTGTDAGPYEVWYKILGDKNYADTEPQKIENVEILRTSIENGTITLGEQLTYNGKEQTQTVTGVTVEAYFNDGNFKQVPATFEVTGNKQTNAGTHTLTVTGTGNFVGDLTKDFTIKPFEATVTPDAGQGKVYGDAEPTLQYTVNLFEGDVLEGKLGRAEGENAADYAYNLGTLENSNYALKLAENAPVFTITPRTADLLWDKTVFPYDGNSHLPGAQVSNLVGSDEVTVTTDGAQTDAGNYTATATALEGAAAANYQLPANTTTDFEIQKADAVFVTEPTMKKWLTYNGEEQILLNPGFSNHGTVLYSLNRDSGYSENIPTKTDFGAYEIWYKVQGDKNHKDSEPQSVNGAIWQKSIEGAEITLGDALTYNGTEQTQTVTGVTIAVTLNDGTSKQIPVTYEVTENIKENAGTYTLKVKGTENFTGEQTKEFTISPFAAIVTPDADQGKSYGDADPTLTYTANLFDGDTLDGTLGRAPGEDVGEYAYTLGTLENTNYALQLADPVPKFTVEAKDISDQNLTVTLNRTEFSYDGTAKEPEVSVKFGEITIPSSEYTVEYRNNVNVTDTADAVVVVKEKADGNYILPAETSVSFNIQKGDTDLNGLAISSQNITYGDTFTVTFTPGVLRQTNAFLRMFTAAPSLETAELYLGSTKIAEDLVNIGEGDTATFTVDTLKQTIPADAFDGNSHEFTVKWGGDSNLKEAAGKVSATLSKKALVGTVKPGQFKGYDGSNKFTKPVELDITPVLGDDVVTATATGTVPTKYIGVSSFTADQVVLASEDAGYYSLAPKDVSGNLEIKPGTLTIHWGNTVFHYDGEAHKPSVRVDGLKPGDDVSVHVNGAQTKAGSYTATLSLSGADSTCYILPDNDSIGFEIVAVAPESMSTPEARNPVANGQYQPLVTPGTTLHGKFVYSLNKDGPYSESIPEAIEPGTYTVWYKILGDGNHEDTEPRMIEVVIRGSAAEATSPKTGDNTHMMLWLSLLVLSVSGGAVTCAYKKKKHF